MAPWAPVILMIIWKESNLTPPTPIQGGWHKTQKKDASLPAIFNPLCSSTNQQMFKKNFCNQSSHYDFHYVWEPSQAYHKIDIFHSEWDTKEDPGRSMKNALYV